MNHSIIVWLIGPDKGTTYCLRGQLDLTFTVDCTCTLVLCYLATKVFYRQITSHKKGGGVSGVGQWWGTATVTEYKIVVTGLIVVHSPCSAPQLSLLQLLHVSSLWPFNELNYTLHVPASRIFMQPTQVHKRDTSTIISNPTIVTCCTPI